MTPLRINLEQEDIPTHWYNVVADMPNPPAPPLCPIPRSGESARAMSDGCGRAEHQEDRQAAGAAFMAPASAQQDDHSHHLGADRAGRAPNAHHRLSEQIRARDSINNKPRLKRRGLSAV